MAGRPAIRTRDPARARRLVLRHLRARVDGELILARIEHCTTALLNDYETVPDRATGQLVELPLTNARVVALKLVIDTSLRMLSKVLPDLKAAELTDGDEPGTGGPGHDRMALATKLLALWREQREAEQHDFLQ